MRVPLYFHTVHMRGDHKIMAVHCHCKGMRMVFGRKGMLMIPSIKIMVVTRCKTMKVRAVIKIMLVRVGIVCGFCNGRNLIVEGHAAAQIGVAAKRFYRAAIIIRF